MQVAPASSQISESISEEYETRAAEFREAFERLPHGNGQDSCWSGRRDSQRADGVFCRGHALLEGAPGLGKTAIVRTLAAAAGLNFRGFSSPDLMPSDIIGTNLIVEDQHGTKRFQFEPGPIFANIILADKKTIAPPQRPKSALLEAMQERQVTIAGQQHRMPRPFLCWRLKIPSRWRAHIRFLKLNSTGSC